MKTITRSAALMNKNGQPILTGAFVLSLVALGIALGSGATAQAQTADWPTKPVRIIVPYSPGGGTDIISRRLAQGLGLTNAQLALAWALSKGDDIVPVTGTQRVTYLAQSVAAERTRLGAEQLAQLEAIFSPDAVAGERYPIEMLSGVGI